MERKIKIEECGELTFTAGPCTGKLVLCHCVPRLCYSHCAAFGIVEVRTSVTGDSTISMARCGAGGVGVIGKIEVAP